MSIEPRVIPFRAGMPIQDPADFVGRKEVLQEISNAMLSLQNVSLHGERRTGKTSLLLYLAHPASSPVIGLPETHIPVYLNFQDLAEASIANVWQAMANAIAEQIRQRHPNRQADAEQFLATIAEFLASPKVPESFSTGFGRALTRLGASGFKIHFLLDEFDQTEHYPNLGEPFYDALRSLPTRAGNVSYVIATRIGLAALQSTYSRVSSPFFNIFTTITLMPFQEDEVYDLIFDYFDRAELDVLLAEKLCTESSFLYDVTGYHPFFLQMLCYHLCASLDKPDWPLGQTRQEALQAFEKNSESHFEFYWGVSSEAERSAMEKFAAGQSIDWNAWGGVARSLRDRCLIVQAESGWQLFSSAFVRWIQEQQLAAWYEEGMIQLTAGKFAQAKECFERIIQIQPGYRDVGESLQVANKQLHLQTLYATAEVQLKEEKWEGAIEVLGEIVRVDRAYMDSAAQLDHARAQYRLQSLYARALGYIREERWSQAIKDLETILKEDQGYRDADDKLKEAQNRQDLAELYKRGIECLGRQSWEEAIAVFEELIQIEPEYKGAWERLEEAQKRAQEKVRKFENLEFLYQVSKIQLERKRWKAAIVCLKRIADSGEQYRDTADLLAEAEKQLKLQTLYADAEVLLKEEKWEEAVRALEDIVQIDRAYRDSDVKLNQAQTQHRLQSLYKRAMSHFSEARWSQAIQDFETILGEKPGYQGAADKLKEAQQQQSLAALYSAAVGFQETGRWDEAIDKFEEIIHWVRIYKLRTYKDVAARLDRAQRQQELDRRFKQGEAYQQQRRWEEAVKEFEQVNAMDPNYQGVQAKLEECNKQLHLKELRKQVEISSRAENWQEAVQILEELRRLDPNDGSVVTKLDQARIQLELVKLYRDGMKCFQEGRWRRAQTALEKVGLLDPNYLDTAAKLKVVQEHLVQSNPVIKRLRDPLWQGIGSIVAIVAFIIAVYPFVKEAFHPVTPTPKPAALCNGDFEKRNFECWQHGGELRQDVKCEGGQCYVVLGDPRYKCEGGVPVGEAWIEQSFQVPQTVSPTLSLRYRVFSYDLDDQDFFQVNINGKISGQFGNTEWGEASCDLEDWDSGWRSAEFDLGPYRGRMVEISLHNINGAIHNVDGTQWWNTWTYVDDVEIR